jgi:hypothetical protein
MVLFLPDFLDANKNVENPIHFLVSYVVESEGMRTKTMDNQKTNVVEGVVIGREHWDVPVRVDLRSYLRFSRQMDCQVRRLVVRWAHAASPWSRGVPVMRAPMEPSVPPIS